MKRVCFTLLSCCFFNLLSNTVEREYYVCSPDNHRSQKPSMSLLAIPRVLGHRVEALLKAMRAAFCKHPTVWRMAWEGPSQTSQVTNSMVHEEAPMEASTKTQDMESTCEIKVLKWKGLSEQLDVNSEGEVTPEWLPHSWLGLVSASLTKARNSNRADLQRKTMCDNFHASCLNIYLDLELWGRCKFGTHQQGASNEITEHEQNWPGVICKVGWWKKQGDLENLQRGTQKWGWGGNVKKKERKLEGKMRVAKWREKSTISNAVKELR